MRSWLGTVSAAGLACAIGCHAAPPMRPVRPSAALTTDMALASTPLPSAGRDKNPNGSEQPSALPVSAGNKAQQQATSLPTLPAQDPSQLPAAPLQTKSRTLTTTIVVGAREGSERQPTASSDSTFDHAADYSWLAGELYFVQSHHCWRLRFAAAGVEDRYGGVVTLTGDGLTPYARDGQIVRVEGTVLNPETTEPQPEYWVRHLIVLKETPTEGN